MRADFLAEVRDALSHLYDYPYLAGHPLAQRFWPGPAQDGSVRAQRLHRLLLESIEELHPATAAEGDAQRAYYYRFLVRRYVDGWSQAEIMREFSCSRRQFYREQSKALMMLAGLLWLKLPNGEPEASPGDALTAEAGRVLGQREPVDLPELVQGVLGPLEHLAAQHAVRLDCTLAPDLPPIMGNRTLLRQVLIQAVSDLIVKPRTRTVALALRPEGPWAVVELAAESDAPGAEGQPLPPLVAARRLVEMVGGQWRGVEGTGAAWTCRFALSDGRRRLILVVEDNEAVVRAFRRCLAGYDYHVMGAATGAEALRMAREAQPHAISLDVMMPAQDGWEVLQALKSDPATRDIPVIICSALDDQALALSLGAVAYLHKPVTQADLLAVLNRL